jgi:hypothetical protein
MKRSAQSEGRFKNQALEWLNSIAELIRFAIALAVCTQYYSVLVWALLLSSLAPVEYGLLSK